VADTGVSRRLEVNIRPPVAKPGDTIVATVEGVNLDETVVHLDAPDTVVISQPHTRVVGTGTFRQSIEWTVAHAKKGTSGTVEITTTAGDLVRKNLCKIIA